MEGLLQYFGRPQALAHATRVRERAAQHLGEWSHARHIADSAHIDRLLERGDFPAAHAAAYQLLAKSVAAGETAYPHAAYDIAIAHMRFGRVLNLGGAADDALNPLAEAQRRLQPLADAGDQAAERMVAVTFGQIGDCLLLLGRFESAAEAYEDAASRSQSIGDVLNGAVSKGQLGTVRLMQTRYDEALQTYQEARDTFQAMGEVRQVAVLWHQIGIVHKRAGHFDESEQAYRQALAIRVRENDLPGQASNLAELGNLYWEMGRNEEAVTFYRQAAEIRVRSKDLAAEGFVRSNLANALVRLGRYDEARHELQRAISCNEPYGHAAQPWLTWAILENLERATGHIEEAEAARKRAFNAYLAYRRAGGESRAELAELFALVAEAIRQNGHDQVIQELNELLTNDVPPQLTSLIRQLQATLTGDRDSVLAASPDLDYMSVAELQYLLETLNQTQPGDTRE